MSETTRRPRSPQDQFAFKMRRAVVASARALTLTALLLPIFFVSFLTLDLPARWLDVHEGAKAYLNPSQWMTHGQFVMAFSFLILNLSSRKYGDGYATAQLALTWGAAAILLFAGLSYLAPALDDTDLPPVRFVVSFVVAWMIGQFVCVSVFELTRAIKWWRAPLYGGLWGAGAVCLIYFPALYWGTSYPWVNWMLADYGIKATLVFVFLAPYAALRGAITPQPGLGGR